MINNRKTVKCGRCGKEAYLTVVAVGFDDAPANFTITEECKGACKKTYEQISASEMHDRTGLPLVGWFATRY